MTLTTDSANLGSPVLRIAAGEWHTSGMTELDLARIGNCDYAAAAQVSGRHKGVVSGWGSPHPPIVPATAQNSHLRPVTLCDTVPLSGLHWSGAVV